MKRILITLVLALAFTATAQTWEYATLEVFRDRTALNYAWYSPSHQVPFKNTLRAILRDIGHPGSRSEGDGDLQEFLFYVGSDGWNLVAIDGFYVERTVYVFKRPAQ